MSFIESARAASIAPTQTSAADGGKVGKGAKAGPLADARGSLKEGAAGFAVTPAVRVEANGAVLVAITRAMAVEHLVRKAQGRGGFGRPELAAAIGERVETVHEWFKDRRGATPPRSLPVLLVLPVFSPRARAEFFNSLIIRGGDLAAVEVRALCPDASPIVEQMLDVNREMGRLSELTRRCGDAASEGGCEVTPVEAAQQLAFAERLAEEVAQVVEALRVKLKQKQKG